MVKIEARRLVYDGWQKLYELLVRDGQASYTREVVVVGDAVAVLPYDETRGMVTLVRQMRPPLLFEGHPPMLLEVPAGLVEDGDSFDDTARREVEEETGLRLSDLRALGIFWPAPGSVVHRVALYIAPYGKDDRVSAGGGLASEHETIEIVEIPASEAIAMVGNGQITDMKTACLLQSLQLELLRGPTGRHKEASPENTANDGDEQGIRPDQLNAANDG